MENLTNKSIRIGEGLLFIAKLQWFWFVSVVRLGILLGIFPSIAAVYYYLFQSFSRFEASSELGLKCFLNKSKEYFKGANILGTAVTVVFLIIYIDWRISIIFLQDSLFTFFLLGLTLIFGIASIYLFPCFVRYEMALKDYYRQAFFLMLCNLANSVAIVLGVLLVVLLMMGWPFFSLFPVPLLLLPVAWFSYQAMLRLEKKNQQ